jgi:hypothetical protein
MTKRPASIRVTVAAHGFELRGYTGQHAAALLAAGCV